MSIVLAQAAVEKGLLDGSAADRLAPPVVINGIVTLFEERPWLILVLAVVIAVLLFRRRA